MQGAEIKRADFHFTESEWDEIGTELGRGAGRLKYEGDRQWLELICGGFATLRPRLGKNIPRPKEAREAWLEVAAAARGLQRAIANLREAGAADFTLIDSHQGGAANWAAQLPSLIEAAKWAAELELLGVRQVSHKADPMRDGFVRQMVRFWEGYGGRVSHAENGPCVRFLMAVTTPAFNAAGEEPMAIPAIQWIVRRIKTPD